MRAHIPNVFSVLILALLAATYFGVFGDLDWTWQVRTGELIVQKQSLRLPDTFSYTIACTGKQPLSWWLPVVTLLWANLHPGVIMGQGVLFGAIAWEWLNLGLRWNRPLDRPALWRLTLIGGLALAATFFSPDPLERLRYP